MKTKTQIKNAFCGRMSGLLAKGGKTLAVLALMLSQGSGQATMIFSFMDNGGGTTLVTATGSADLTGGG